MFGRTLRFLFALPVALAATGATATSLSIPIPDRPESENSYLRADKAAEEPPSVEIADEDQPKFPGINVGDDRRESPVYRLPAQYPEKCMATAKSKEAVFVEFDIAPDGRVANVNILDTTNSCFNEAAATSVAEWKYSPKLDAAGNPTWRRGVQTAITFELGE